MRRRDFLILAAMEAMALAAPHGLWTPNRKIFLPPQGGWDCPLDSLDNINRYIQEMILAEQRRLFTGPLAWDRPIIAPATDWGN